MASSEPNPAIGIDLGTTFSVISMLDSSGRPSTIPNAEGDLTTPSAVYFDDDAILVGKEALKAGRVDPSRLVQFAKRDMGNPSYSRAINGEHYPPEVIQSLILEKLHRDAEQRVGPFTKCVITVPAYFNDPRRKATQDAGRLAGLEVLDIINEPTAAAIAYGVQQGFVANDGSTAKKETILIYDLGGGTFDVTLMAIEGRNYTALATAGDVHLGGIDWDNRLVNRIASEFKSKFGVDVRSNSTACNRLLIEAEELKRSLSAKESASISFEHGQHALRLKITREEFEILVRDLLDRTRFTTSQVLREAGIGWKDLTRVLLVGGSTRMPMVSAMLEHESGKKPNRTLSEDEVVGHGAAIYAGLLLTKSDSKALPRLAVTNVNSHSLGVLGIEPQTNRPRNVVLIPKNSKLPATSKSAFKTRHADQRTVVVNVIEGGDASGANSTPIGRCILQDLPEGLPAGVPVEVEFAYGTDGRLTVNAKLPSLGMNQVAEIERASGLTDQQRSDWVGRVRRELRPLIMNS